jgi:hypothetical protein
MKTLSSILLGLLLIVVFSYMASADSAAGTVNVTASDVQITSSSGGGGNCLTNWTCTDWSGCILGFQVRTCSKIIIYCNAGEKPSLIRKCVKSAEKIAKSAEKQVLFDINLNLPKKEIISGANLTASLGLTNLGVPGKTNISLNYTIKDSFGNIVYSKIDTLIVETQTEFLKEFDVSKLAVGEYSISADLKYEGQKEPARAEEKFSIVAEEKRLTPAGIAFLVLIALAVLFAVFKSRIIKFFRKLD